jgi:hypothetical protein
MRVMPTTAVSEARPANLVGKEQREGHIQDHIKELKQSESPSAGLDANGRIIEYIHNGLRPEQIDKRLESQLQRTEVQRALINEISPYSDRINSSIKTTQELAVYIRNNLQESNILDRPCLQLNIDPQKTDEMGRSNMDRMATGLAPIDENGDSVNLHHIGQKENSPLAELPDRVHKEYDAILHDKTISTEVHGPGNRWNEQKSQYWQERARTL